MGISEPPVDRDPNPTGSVVSWSGLSGRCPVCSFALVGRRCDRPSKHRGMVRGRSERPIGGELVALRRQKPQASALVTARQGSTAERTESPVLVEAEQERGPESTTPKAEVERPLM